MRQPWVMTCSDGSEGHPRKYGTFPRKLHEYVYRRHVISLEFAIRSSTSLPAQTLGLKDRGLLKPGYFADVLVLTRRRSTSVRLMRIHAFLRPACDT